MRGVPAGGRTGPRGETRTTPSSFPEPHAWAPHTHTGHRQGGHSSWVSGRSPGGHLLPQRDSQERHVFSKVPTFGSRLSFFIHGSPPPPPRGPRSPRLATLATWPALQALEHPALVCAPGCPPLTGQLCLDRPGWP